MNRHAMIEGNELAVMRHALLIAEQRDDDMAALFAGIGQHEAALIGSCVDDVTVARMRGEDEAR